MVTGFGRFRASAAGVTEPVAWMPEAALKESRDRLAEAQRLAHVGSWTVDLVTGKHAWSDELYRLLGYEPGEVEPDLERVRDRLEPAEAERIWPRFLARMAHPDGWEEEFQIVLPGGALRWLASRTEPVLNRTGAVVAIHGTSQDVTERRQVQQQLRFQGQLLNAVDEAIIATDLEGVVVYWGPGAERLYGWSAPEVSGLRIEDVIPVVPRVHDRDEVRGRLAGGRPWTGTMERGRRDGSTFAAHVSATPVHDDSGRLVGTISVCSDVSAQEEASAALERARDHALAASHLKSHFLANMSHEIRTPMNGVLGMTELLLETPLDERQREYAQAVRGCGDDLLAILNDILDLSDIDAGQLELESVDFDVAAIVEDVAERFANRARAKGVELVISIGADVPGLVRGDPARVRQVLANLVGNAVKFTSTGLVMVSACTDRSAGEAGALRLQVDDTGIGISAATVARIFEPFSQVDSTATREYGGTGVGLAITRQLVELIGGRCGVDSELGMGSSFWCSLDLPEVPSGATPPRPADLGLRGARALVVDDSPASRLAIEGYLRGWGMDVTGADSGAAALEAARRGAAEGRPFGIALTDMHMPGMNGHELAAALATNPEMSGVAVVLLDGPEALGRRCPTGISGQLTKPVRRESLRRCLTELVVSAAVAPSGAEAPAGATRILLAEDNVINQKVTVSMLESDGYRVDVVGNGVDAVTAMKKTHYDLVLMDCHMPRMGGLQASAAIRAGEGGRGWTPIVALTAAGTQEEKDRCLAAGMDDHLAKPVRKSHLLATVARWAGAAGPAVRSTSRQEAEDVPW